MKRVSPKATNVAKKDSRLCIRLSPEIHQRLKKFKGSKTWDGFFKSWLDHFEGFNGNEDEIRYITNGEWDIIIKRIERLEHIGGVYASGETR